MKKLTVLLAAVMAFAFSATAYAATPSDLAEQPVKVQDAFAKTMALGIINGYEDGTVGPEQNITRAEFAKIAVTAAGAKDTAEMLANNTSSFKDVKAGQWYTGWINASESLGIFQGDGNGNFRPNDTITNQEVITVLMRLLGYNDNLTGTWPVNYVTQANKSEILDDVAIVAAEPAKRADVVVMLDATLDSNLVTYDKDTDEFVNKQTTKGGNDTDTISLLADSFKGSFIEVTGTNATGENAGKAKTFEGVSQIKDADKKQLTWTVFGDDTVIIDDETRVSYNGGSLFDLEGHQGKVYTVKENDKTYARFIEVESYAKTSTGTPAVKDDGTLEFTGKKIKMDKTTYNATTKVYEKLALESNKPTKNSNYVLYFNEDDQVYAVASDKEYKDQNVSYVKSVNSSTVKLVGDAEKKSLSLSDDILVYTAEGFIGAKDLKVGDAVKQIAADLFVKVEEQTGTLSKASYTTEGTKKNITSLTIGGKNYKADKPNVLDAEMEDADASLEDIYGNEVKFVLNNDNSVAAVIVDATSTGTKLYGIVVGGDGNTNGFGNNKTATTVSIFTEEGKTVSYEYDSDIKTDEKMTSDELGMLVEYKLNKDGEIKSIKANEDGVNLGTEVTVQNNAYLKYEDSDSNTKSVSLASNVVVFEVDNDGDDIDATIVTRASVLAQDDFTATDVTFDDEDLDPVDAYVYGYTNNNGALRALAYTNASNTTYYYGVVAEDILESADHDNALTLLDDENEYELVNPTGIAKNDLIIYTKSGEDVTVVWHVANKGALVADDFTTIVGGEVDSYTDGVITFETDVTFFSFEENDDNPVEGEDTLSDGTIMTNTDTVVMVLGDDGKYTYGTTEDIASGDMVYVIIGDEDGYVDLLVVDNYNDYNEAE